MTCPILKWKASEIYHKNKTQGKSETRCVFGGGTRVDRLIIQYTKGACF
jgi:hypothetical protein